MRITVLVCLILGCSMSPANAARFTPLVYQQKSLKWNRDKDQNGIEDYLDRLIASTGPDDERKVDVIVVLGRDNKTDNITRIFREYGTVDYVGKYLTYVCLKSVPVAKLNRLAKADSVAAIEYNWPIGFALNTSVAAIQVRSSTAYAHSVESDYPAIDGTGVGIAIMDTGVYNRDAADTTGHKNLPHARFIAGYDAITDTETDPPDSHGHGTFMASVALGSARVTGNYRGVAHGAGLIDINVTTGSSWDVLRGIDKCIEKRKEWNIRVINMSFGQVDLAGNSVNDDGTCILAQACNYAVSQGIVIVAATCNDGAQIIPAPASADDVIAVGGINDRDSVDRSDDVLYANSNFGPRLDDFDGSILDERKPLVVAPGERIVAAGIAYSTHLTVRSGTSVSAPHVAGVAALIIQKCPEITPLGVAEVLRQTAVPHTAADWDPKWGYGTVNGYEAVHQVCQPHADGGEIAHDVGFPCVAEPAWLSPDLSTASPPVVGKNNQVLCNIKNFGTHDASGVLLTVGVSVFGNTGNQYHAIGQRRFDVAAGETTTVSVDWVPQDSLTGNACACLCAEIGYGIDQNFQNNQAKRNLLISGSCSSASADHTLLTIQNQLPETAELTVTPYEVNPANKNERKNVLQGVLADALTYSLGPQDPAVTFPVGLPELSGDADGESTRHIDFVVKAKLGDGSLVQQGGVRFIQSRAGGTPPSIALREDRIVVSDDQSGVAYVEIVSISGGSALVDSFVPGAKSVGIRLKPDGTGDLVCTLAVWDCALNRTEKELVLSNANRKSE